MVRRLCTLVSTAALLGCATAAVAQGNGRFDLLGPRIDVRVTRGDTTLPIASVPNLQPGDKLWLHPDLPPTQSVHYLLICVFLRGTTNPPPDQWFLKFETWQRPVREEGVYVTVPPEAQQAVLFLAPETGGDFGTLRSAVQGRPGVFVRASQDLAEAGFEQARIEKYLASIRRVPATDPGELQKRSDLLARTLALKPNDACFKQPVDTQFTCLTQTGSQTLLDDGHGNTVVNALSNGPGSDFITAASYTQVAGGGVYSAYVGAVVDLVRLLGNLHTAKYQYIPAIAFPQAESLNLRLNTPPSFHNPKSVLVIGLPSVQPATAPPLRPAHADEVVCLLAPTVVVPIEGAPLVFSTELAHGLRLHFDVPPGAPAEPDLPLVSDAYQGGLVIQSNAPHRTELRDAVSPSLAHTFADPQIAAKASSTKPAAPQPPTAPEPIQVSATIRGMWGFDPFTGPTVRLQQLPGTGWRIVSAGSDAEQGGLIAGKPETLTLTSTGSACVHTITAQTDGDSSAPSLSFKAAATPDAPQLLRVTLPLEHQQQPGDLHLTIQQYGQPKPDDVATRTFAEPAHVTALVLHAGDASLTLEGEHLGEITRVKIGDLVFDRDPALLPSTPTLRFTLAPGTKPADTHNSEALKAELQLNDGRSLPFPFVVGPARPHVTLIGRTVTPAAAATPPPDPTAPPATLAPARLQLSGDDDMPLADTLTFTLKTHSTFPRTGQVEVETVDGTLRTVLTLAPAGGLQLQDPHTIVATLDPQRAMGPSAFGPLHARVLYQTGDTADKSGDADGALASDWLPLITLVRLPQLRELTCTADTTQPCELEGKALFLIDQLSADPGFHDARSVPDGFTGSTVAVPHVTTGTLYLHLRDDPALLVTASVPELTPPHAHAHTTPATTPAPAVHSANN